MTHQEMLETLLGSMPPRTGVRVYYYSNSQRIWSKWPTLYEAVGAEAALRHAKREARKNLANIRTYSPGFDPGPIAYEVIREDR